MNVQKRKKRWGNNPKFKVQKVADGPTSSNRFQLLSEDEGDEVTKKEKIPPIIVDSSYSFSAILAMIGDKYLYKRMSTGTKIISSSLVLYEEALKMLKSKNINFYTHEVRDRKIFKMVLFGLPRETISVIIEEFKSSHNITPVSVKEIETKRSTADDALYLIEFDRQHVSKQEILKIRYFCNIAIHWRKPFKSNKGPTQCTKCSMYGHGARNCNRVKVCTACAGNHDYADCTLNKGSPDGSIVYKCHNCTKKNYKNVNHRADDPKCPCRREYLDIRQRLTAKSRMPSIRYNSNFAIDDSDFPLLPNQEHHAKTQHYVSQGKSLLSDICKNKTRDNNDDLSNEKLLEIFFNAIDALEKCQTKFDKLRVLGMMLKHAI